MIPCRYKLCPADGSIHLVGKYLLSTYYVPGSILGPGEILVTKTDEVPVLKEYLESSGEAHNQKVRK